jgi:hypothetical protein
MFKPTRPRLLTAAEMTAEQIISLQQQGIDPYATPEERNRKALKAANKSLEIYRRKVDGRPPRWI